MTIIGTASFVSRKAANSYYADYGCTVRDVQRKIDTAEIFIGKPPFNPENGEKLVLLDEGRRYGIDTDSTPRRA